MHIRRHILALAGPGLLLAQPAYGQETDQSSEIETQQDGLAQGPIIVTAERRASELGETSIAISAISGDTLRNSGDPSFAEIASQVPSLTFGESFGITQLYIRGVGNSFFSPGGDPGVATYADGVYLSDQEATGVAFLDLERVEVLRGPPGALYGRNATGGAVNLISAQPTSSFEGRIGLQAGDFGRLIGDGYLSGPLGSNVRARLSFQYRHIDGFTENELEDLPGAPDRLDAEDSWSGRLQLEADIGAGSLRFIASGYTQDDHGPALKILPDPTPLPAEFLFGARPSADERSLRSQINENERDVWSTTAIFNHPVGGTDLTIIGDYRQSDRFIVYDQDGTEFDVTTIAIDTESEQASIEAYVQGEVGDAEWLVGGTYLWFRQDRVTDIDGVVPLGFFDPTLPLDVPAPFVLGAGGTVTTEAWAIYAEGTVPLGDQFELRIGGRYSEDSKDADEFLAFLAPPISGQVSDTWGEWSGKVGIDWTPTEDVLLYASVARGFKSGALNLGAFTPPVDPEINVTYEIGVKADTADRTFSVAAAAFLSDYQDLQIVQIGPVSQLLTNAASSRINGFELEFTVRPSRNFTFSVAGSYLDAEFDDFTAVDQRRGFQVFDVSGNQLPFTSEWQVTANADYGIDLPDGSLLSFDASVQLRSEYFFTEFNSPDARQSGFVRIDAGLSWLSRNEAVRLYGFVRNLTDETVLSSLAIASPLLGSARIVTLEPPRHFGIGADFRF